MKFIRNILNSHRTRIRDNREMEIRHRFEVVERSGSLWLIHNGDAFAKIAADTSADQIAAALDDARETAIEFETI